MNSTQNGKTHNLEKPLPGCLGRMVNLFDLSTGMPGNRLLADRSHRDGSPLSRSRSDVSRMSPTGDQIEDEKTISELRRTSSSRKLNGTPIKMLIAKEMLKEVDSKQNPPSVVAKLMGLDALPRQQLDSSSQRSHSSSSSPSQSGISFAYWEQEHRLLETQPPQIHQYPEQNDYKDVCEIWQSHNNYIKDKSPQKERFNGSGTEKKMALVRQNFIELKRLATDEKLRQSKQFQDALEVLSSNKDSFLKFLQEPNSMFSQHLYDLQSIPPPPETKHITILKPAKIVDDNKFAKSGKKNEKQINKTSQFGQVNRWDKSTPAFSPPVCKLEDSHTRATRIVVLKPSPGKSHDDIKAVVSPLSSSPRALNVEDSYVVPEDDDAQESREVAKEITRQMHENLSGHRRNETLLSSALSNGYTGDESSFNKSENEYAVENLSDSEVVSSTSRHSWDYVHKFGGPYSLSSSRASYSPESSVCREAKKRLSERWSMMASNGIGQEQRHIRRSSSTLGEMLALSDIKKSVKPEEDGSNKEQESRATSCLNSDSNDKDICDTTSPRNLLRSKSVPGSSTAYGARLNLEVSDPKMEKTDVTKEVTKERCVKSFKGRVSSLFFSRNKKSSKEKSIQPKDEIESAEMPRISPRNYVDTPAYGSDIGFKVGVLPDLHGSSSKTSSLDSFGTSTKQDIIPNKTEFSVTRPCTNGNPNENQEQPSPISVLEPPFDEDDHRELEFSDNFKPDRKGLDLPVYSIKSNLIDKSPLIGSIARTLSWDDSCTETATPYPLKSSVAPIGAEEEQQEWFFFVQELLSAANFDSEVQSDTLLARWHSLESPLDPSLRDKFIDLNDKETLHEAKRRQRRSTRKLVFDCINAALVDIAGYGSDPCQRAIPCSGPNDRVQDQASTIMDCVWVQMKQWFSGEVRCVFGECGDNNSLVVERVARKEVVGKGWIEHLRLEINNFRKEIERKLLEELVLEAVEEFTGRE